MSATVGTLPLVATYFHTVPLVGFAANLLIVPFLGSAAVVLGLAAAALVFLHEGAAPCSCGVPEPWFRSA